MGVKKNKTLRPTKPKTDLGHKLFHLRKQMNKSLLDKWFEWAQNNRDPKMTESVFNAITRGDYISKDNVWYATYMWKEGKRLLDEFNSSIDDQIKEVEGSGEAQPVT